MGLRPTLNLKPVSRLCDHEVDDHVDTVAGGKSSEVVKIMMTGPSAEPLPAPRDLLSL